MLSQLFNGHQYLIPLSQLNLCDAGLLAEKYWANTYQKITLRKYQITLEYFIKYSHQHNIYLINDVTANLIRDFAYASIAKDSQLRTPTEYYVRTKLFAIRWLYKSLQLAGYPELIDITQMIPLPPKPISQSHIISEEIADQLLFYSHINNTYKEPVIVGLLLSGVWSGEIGYLTISDVNCADSTLFVHGTGKYQTRTLLLEPHINHTVTQRIKHLNNSSENTGLLCTKQAVSPGKRQADITAALRRVIRYAGLTGENITPASLTAYAGKQLFNETASIADVARLLGLRSLDSAARIIGYHWWDN